jgi:hypothetical protein
VEVVKSGIILLIAAIAACGQNGAIALSASTERPIIIAGEPLFVAATLRSTAATPILFRTDGDGLRRSTIAPDGRRTDRDPPEMTGDAGYFSKQLTSAAEETIRFVAGETVSLTQPGDYRMIVEYPPFHASGEFRFTIRPYGLESLRTRAQDIHDSALLANRDAGLNETALAAMDPRVSEPLTPRRLEEIGDHASVACLIEVLPKARGNQREVVIGALRRLQLRTTDGDLLQKMQRALSAATP